jgi:hypothetical protein
VNDALDGSEASTTPCQRDHRGKLPGRRVVDAGPLCFGRNLVCDCETEFQCLRLHDHALDMAFDQITIINGGRVLCFTH